MHVRAPLIGLAAAFALSAGLLACGKGDEPFAPTPSPTVADTGVDSAEAIAAMTPLKLTASFYRWHVSFPGNPLLHTRDKWGEYFTPDFIQRVEEILAPREGPGGGFDPFLCAQDVPADFAFAEEARSDNEATIRVRKEWGPGSPASELTVHLVRLEGRWWIERINCTPLAAPSDS